MHGEELRMETGYAVEELLSYKRILLSKHTDNQYILISMRFIYI